MPEIVAKSEVGKQKSTNEDTVLTEQIGNKHLLVVADGMGGHAAGDVASECAAETLRDTVSNGIDKKEEEELLSSAVQDAHNHIQEQAADVPARSNMGTTVVAALVDGDNTVIINVGDSRAYDVGATIEQITVDQSLVQELVEQGDLTQEEAADHPQRNVLSQAVGTSDELEPDIYHHTLDGVLLLCSDGLTDEVPSKRIKDIVSESETLERRATELVDVANQIDGSDNVSIVLYE
jgi:serine/threonine protein phosphatase PrpC